MYNTVTRKHCNKRLHFIFRCHCYSVIIYLNTE